MKLRQLECSKSSTFVTMKEEYLFSDYASFLSAHFEGKVQKLSVDGGFGCPNRDGTIGRGGCAYCNNSSFTPPYCQKGDSVRRQIELGKQFFSRKYPEMRYLAYFQAHTNTYAPLAQLKRCYEEALSVEGVVGLVIGTRPDCVPDELLDYLSLLNRSVQVVLELGIEAVDDKLLRSVNRGHTFAQAESAVRRAAERGIPTAGHIILGLPGETRESILRQPAVLSTLPLTILKLHQLQIVSGTSMAADYAKRREHYSLFETPESYANLLCDYLERLRPDLILERFTSQSPSSLLIAPHWGMKNFEFVELLKRCLRERHTYQGRLYSSATRV